MGISQQKNFNVFVNKSTLYLMNLNGDKIDCQKAEEVLGDEEYENYREHMKSLRKDIFSSPYKHENLNDHRFRYTIERLQRLQQKKKLFCRNCDHYLVKKSFTEGIQYVKQGEIHTYEPIGRPLDIFVSNNAIDAKTFRFSYDSCTKPKRILPGETENIPANTYYAVIAPCHTIFIKKIKNSYKIEKSTEMAPSLESGAVYQVTQNINGYSSSKQTDELVRSSPFPRPLGSRDDENGDSWRSFKLEKFDKSEMVSGNDGTVSKRSSTECDGQSKRVKSSIHEPKPSTSQITNVIENRNGYSSSKQTNLPVRTSPFPPPFGSRDDENGDSRRSFQFQRFDESEMVSDNASIVSRRSLTEYDRELEQGNSNTHDTRPSTSQMELSLIPPSPNSLRNQLELMSSTGTSDGGRGRAVFAIRKDSDIESYSLRPKSDFKILQDNIMTGSFVIENDDMDPCVIEYHGDVQYIREVATFKNGSVFETTLNVQKDLVDELRDATKKKEKVVVNYFFEYTFKAIEAAYKRFSQMRNTKMIGSCVPAIVSLGDSRFVGAVSDAYEGKP